MRFLSPDVDLATRIDDLTKQSSRLTAMKGTWTKNVRRAIGLPGHALAARLGISQPALAQIEKREAEGAITIESLETVADSNKRHAQNKDISS